MADSTDSALKTYVILWVSGLIAGVILIERWRRKGRELIPLAPPAPAAVEAPSVSTTAPVPLDKRAVPAALVAGAKADVARIRRVALQATPWTRHG